ncbi:amiloride-sensitive sodium channel subunit beta-like [Physella acuta]|uniref:amiloride-sensitive sodium channel subunit beta-like n=1 Tax=Physella acuta TaxID=109671 RepID=UPI0027DD94A9|nr:amiloride-sensitive sodium channel subunit beta-like [Physella acuta]
MPRRKYVPVAALLWYCVRYNYYVRNSGLFPVAAHLGPTQVTRRKRQAAQRMSGTDKSSIAVDWSKLLSNSTFTKWDMLNSSGAGSFYQTKDDEYEATMTYAYITAILNSSTVEPAGHQKKDFIASCKFGGYYCSPMNFTYFHNHKYGNCYTFNSRHVEGTLTTRFPGPTYGLILELFINQQEYIANLASEAGARIIIHKKGTIPFPEDEGISVIPGRSSSIGIKQVSYSRLPPPHGVCGYEAKTTDYYVHYLGTSHSKLSCLKSCYQDIIMEYCACAVTFFYIIPNVTICNMTDPITENCVNSLPSIASERYKLCDEKCPQPCEETRYELSISQAGWPSTKYQDFLREKLGQTNALYIQAANTQDEFTKVQIYYQDLIYQHVEQQKAYESMNLISDLGGQLGLWLGLSAITIGEFCSFLFSIGRSLPSKCCSAKTSPGPGTSVTSIQPVILEDLYDDLKSDACRYIQSDTAFPQSSEYFP